MKPPHETTTTAAATTTTKPPHQTTTTAPSQTTTTLATTTTTGGGGTTTTTQAGTTTTGPVITPFGINVFAVCTSDFLPGIQINFPVNAALNGQSGILDFSDGTSYGPLVYRSGGSITIPWPASLQSPLTLTYRIQGQTATATVELTPNCGTTTTTTSTPSTTTTTTSPTSTTGPTTTMPGSTTTSTGVTTTTISGTTTTTLPGTTTTLPATFQFSGAATVCRAEVPTIVIDFATPGFPSLAGQTGTLTMSDINGNVVSTQPLVYQPGGHVELLYPGTTVNADGSIDDVPGWILTDAGLWVRDPSDEYLRDGIRLTYTVNPTATAFITYPPESSACANPENPPAPPGAPTTRPGTPPKPGLPPTGNDPLIPATAALVLAAGATLAVVARRKRV
jgi:hypothetical protein